MTNLIFIFLVNNIWFSLFKLNRMKRDGFKYKFENISLEKEKRKKEKNRKGTTKFNFVRMEYISDQILESYFIKLKRNYIGYCILIGLHNF